MKPEKEKSMLTQLATSDQPFDAANPYSCISETSSQLGRAESLAVRALEMLTATGGGDHPDMADVFETLAEIAHENGQSQEAQRYQVCAARLWQRLAAPPRVVSLEVPDAGWAVPDDDRAQRLYRRSLRLFDRALDRCGQL